MNHERRSEFAQDRGGLARGLRSVRPWSRLRIVAVRGQIASQDTAEVFLGRSGRRPVVVGQIEIRASRVEGLQDIPASIFEWLGTAKVLP